MTVHTRSHVFIVRDGQMLVLRHAHGTQWWGHPGGDVEADEDPASAVIRETREETALEIDAPVLLRRWSYRDRRSDLVECYAYVVEAPDGDVVLSDEHIDHAWMPVEEYVRRHCGDEIVALAPEWAGLFLAEMRQNCALLSAWLRARSPQ